jgi:predicted nucleic acid-binding protein
VIILDTNIISELTRRIPEPGVTSWLDSLPAEEVGTTAVTAAELLYGVARMPAGRRKTELAAAVRGLLGDEFRDRVLPFDEHCASRYADIVCGRETLGRPISVADAQIAAICRTAEATLATRNTNDFSGTGIELINPWKLDRPGPA